MDDCKQSQVEVLKEVHEYTTDPRTKIFIEKRIEMIEKEAE